MDLSTCDIDGRPFYYREGTFDSDIIAKTFHPNPHEREYLFPQTFKDSAKVILDIGANIGATTCKLEAVYPHAMVYAFEPEKNNYKILERNTLSSNRIQSYQAGLYNDNFEYHKLYASDDPRNHGGFSLFSDGSNPKHVQTVRLIEVDTFLKKEEIQKVDIIKIDCEGAEYKILSAFPKEILSKVDWIEGELHNWESYKLMSFLSKYFDLQFSKKFGNRCWTFHALNLRYDKALFRS